MKNKLFIYRIKESLDSTLYFLNNELIKYNIELYDFKFYSNELELSSIKSFYINKGFNIEFSINHTKYKPRNNPRLGHFRKIKSLHTIMTQPEHSLSNHIKNVYKNEIKEFQDTKDIKLYHELYTLINKNKIKLDETKANRNRLRTLQRIIKGDEISQASKYRYKNYIKELQDTGKIQYFEKFKHLL